MPKCKENHPSITPKEVIFYFSRSSAGEMGISLLIGTGKPARTEITGFVLDFFLR